MEKIESRSFKPVPVLRANVIAILGTQALLATGYVITNSSHDEKYFIINLILFLKDYSFNPWRPNEN